MKTVQVEAAIKPNQVFEIVKDERNGDGSDLECELYIAGEKKHCTL